VGEVHVEGDVRDVFADACDQHADCGIATVERRLSMAVEEYLDASDRAAAQREREVDQDRA
jgi:hypothetical protein